MPCLPNAGQVRTGRPGGAALGLATSVAPSWRFVLESLSYDSAECCAGVGPASRPADTPRRPAPAHTRVWRLF